MPLPQAGGSQIQLDKETAEQLSGASVDLGEVQSMIADTSAKDEQQMEALKDELTELLDEVGESEQDLLNSIIKQVSEQEKELTQQEKRWENLVEKQEQAQNRTSAGRAMAKSAPQVQGEPSQPDNVPAADQEQTQPEDQITGIKRALKTDLIVPFDSAIERLENTVKKDPKETVLQKIDRVLDPDEIEKQRQEAERGHSLRREALQEGYRNLKEAVGNTASTLTGTLEEVSPILSKAIPAFKSAVSGIGKIRGKLKESAEKKRQGMAHPDQPEDDEEPSQPMDSASSAIPMLPGASEEPSAPQEDLIDKQPAAEAGLGGDDGVLSQIASDVGNIFGIMKKNEQGQEIKQLEKPETGLAGEGDQASQDAGTSAMNAMSNQADMDPSIFAETLTGVGAEGALDFARQDEEEDDTKYLITIANSTRGMLALMKKQATERAVQQIESQPGMRGPVDDGKRDLNRDRGVGTTIMGGIGAMIKGAVKVLGKLAKGGLFALLLGGAAFGGFKLGQWLLDNVLPEDTTQILGEAIFDTVQAFKKVGNWVSGLYNTFVNELSMLMSDPWGTLKRWIIGAAELQFSIASQVLKLGKNLGSLALDMFTTLGQWIFGEKLFASMQKKMSTYIGNVVAGFKSLASFIMDPASFITSLVFGEEAAKKFEKKRASVGQSIMDGLSAIANYVKNPEKIVSDLFGFGEDEEEEDNRKNKGVEEGGRNQLTKSITEQARKGELSDKRFNKIKEVAAKEGGTLTVESVERARQRGIEQGRNGAKVQGAGQQQQANRNAAMKSATERSIRAEEQAKQGGAGGGTQQNNTMVNSPNNRQNTVNVFGDKDIDRSARRHQDSIAPMGTP